MSPPEQRYTVDDLQVDLYDLKAQLCAVYAVLHEMPYERDGRRDKELDAVASLTRVSQQFLDRICTGVDAGCCHLGRKPGR